MPVIWTRVREFYGLNRPFDFKVAIPFLLNVCVLAVVFLACMFLFFTGGLSIGTQRFYFFSYIAGLLLVAAAFSKAGKFSYAVLSWCVIELGLAFASSALEKRAPGTSLFPKDIAAEHSPEDDAFIYHPLLQLVPRPNFQYTSLMDFRGIEEKANAAGVDVAGLQGRELRFSHNSLGIRGEELSAGDLSKDLIFVYGGSTTYDVGVTQGQTWVEQLQSDLDNKYTILNFGVVAHSTEEHLIETAFYQNVAGKAPVCAIYYVGWNDIINSHIETLDHAYADYHVLTTAIRRPDLAAAKYSPIFFLLNDLAKNRFDTIPKIPKILGKPPVPGSDKRLEAIFIEHVKTIAAINAARGTKTIFVGQMLNKGWPQGPNIWAPLVSQGDFPPLAERFNSILKDAAASIPAKYIDPGVTNFGHGDWVDLGHFSAAGAKKFAALLSGEVGSHCR